MEYNDKVVLVTGASNGIGRCVAETYAAKGAFVILADKDEAEGERVAENIQKAGHQAAFIHADISLVSDIQNLFRQVKERFGRMDVLVNNAGLGCWKSPCEPSVDEWDGIINTNLRGTFLCAREAALLMRDNGGGNIINIASTRAFMSEPNSEAYAASKGGILSLTHGLATGQQH